MQSLKHAISSANDNVTTCQSVVETKYLEYKAIKERLQEMMKEERQGKAQLEAAIQSWEQAKKQRKVAEEDFARACEDYAGAQEDSQDTRQKTNE